MIKLQTDNPEREAAMWELRRQWLAVLNEFKRRGAKCPISDERIEAFRKQVQEHFNA